MRIQATGIICAVRAHAEHGAIVRLLTEEHGLQAGYVRGGRSRRLKPVLSPGNVVVAELRARTGDQLASLTLELAQSRAPLLEEPLASAAVDWTTALTAATLPEAHPYPRIFEALAGVLDAIEAAPVARGWAAGLVRFEWLILAELGFGTDLPVEVPTIREQLRENRLRLGNNLLTGRLGTVLAARDRLVDRLTRAIIN